VGDVDGVFAVNTDETEGLEQRRDLSDVRSWRGPSWLKVATPNPWPSRYCEGGPFVDEDIQPLRRSRKRGDHART